jgi:proteic killer suppression protein
MVLSFKDKDTELVYNRQFSKRLPQNIQHTALRKLVIIHNSVNLVDIKVPPGNKLEQLHGDREGQYSIRINSQWRICFNWEGNNAFNVEIVDYH